MTPSGTVVVDNLEQLQFFVEPLKLLQLFGEPVRVCRIDPLPVLTRRQNSQGSVAQIVDLGRSRGHFTREYYGGFISDRE